MVRGVVSVLCRDGGLLMIQRARNLVAGGMWCFPGGAIEAGETGEDALIRELREELDLVIRPECTLWQWSSPAGDLHIEWWSATILSGDIRPNPAEVAECRWMTPGEILEERQPEKERDDRDEHDQRRSRPTRRPCHGVNSRAGGVPRATRSRQEFAGAGKRGEAVVSRYSLARTLPASPPPPATSQRCFGLILNGRMFARRTD